MPVLDLTEDQIVSLLRQMPEDQRKRVMQRSQEKLSDQPVPKFGIAKGAILYMAPDFDEPLDDFRDYME